MGCYGGGSEWTWEDAEARTLFRKNSVKQVEVRDRYKDHHFFKGLNCYKSIFSRSLVEGLQTGAKRSDKMPQVTLF